jgi:hypothetical protein
VLGRLKKTLVRRLDQVRTAIAEQLRPSGAISGVVVDQLRTKAELRAENALLRQQLLVACRKVKRARLTTWDRLWMLLAAAKTPGWRESLVVVKPDTVRRWHRQGFRLLWRMKTSRTKRDPRIPEDTVALIKQMAADNHLWGAEPFEESS